MKKFILGFVMAIISIVIGALISIGKIVHRGSKNMPWTTKRYIKDQFTFVDISKVKNAIANSIKAFVDWVFFAKETTCFNHRDGDVFDRSYHAQKHNDICKAIDKCMAKSDTSKPKPYFINEDECGHYTTYFMYDISTGKLYENYDDEEVTSHDFIKDMLKTEDPCLIEPGNYVYIHDPRDGTDYSIAIEDLSQDEEEENGIESVPLSIDKLQGYRSKYTTVDDWFSYPIKEE